MYKKLLEISKKLRKLANKKRFFDFNESIGIETNSNMEQSLDSPINNLFYITNTLDRYVTEDAADPKIYTGPQKNRETRYLPTHIIDDVTPPKDLK